MAKVPQPSARGCSTATYPSLVWREVACVAPPSAPMTPKPPKPPGPQALAGGGNDVVAVTPAGPIIQASGSFEAVTGVGMGAGSVSSPVIPGGPPVPDAYTLQLNTNYFPTPLCDGAQIPALCLGWQQFVYANDGASGAAYIEYWLLSYLNPCPDGWTAYTFEDSPDAVFCYQKSLAAAVPNTPLTNVSMPALVLSGVDNGSSDAVFFQVGDTIYASAGVSQLDPGPNWTMAEFNVFGYGRESMAEFHSDADFNVRTRINYGGTTEPGCQTTGFTGETNNLSFVLPRPPVTAPGPAIVFHEARVDSRTTGCDAAVAVGDTHQQTFAGLLYDFQAAGDFVETQVGTGFEVQTRKVSGAPAWPNASVNRSVATRMGSTRVALCDGTRLVVDGSTTDLAPGGTLSLPSGVAIERAGNAYVVKDQSGNSVRVTANAGSPSYTDLQVGVGSWPTAVRGLLGNPGNDPHRLEAKDGTRFTVPISFSDLYNGFGASWRVNPLLSLLQPCGTVASGNPSGPFFARDLNPTLRQQAQTICRQAGVATAWLDTCTLDVAVLGWGAAAVFVGREPPAVFNNPPPPECPPTIGCFGGARTPAQHQPD